MPPQHNPVAVKLSSAVSSLPLLRSDPPWVNLFVVDVDGNPFAEHQFHRGGVAELHRGFDNQVNALVGGRDAVQVHRIVNGRVP